MNFEEMVDNAESLHLRQGFYVFKVLSTAVQLLVLIE